MNSDLLKKVTKKSDQIHIDKDKAKKALEKNLLAKGSDAVATISGYVQEGLINNITGAPVAGGGTRLDFPTMSSQTRERLKILYGDDGGVKAADAKPEAKGSNFTAIGNKYIGEMLSLIHF